MSFSFASGTEGRALPEGVTGQLPAAYDAAEGSTVTAPLDLRPVRDDGGTWWFREWSDNGSATVAGADVAFAGTWEWVADPKTEEATLTYVAPGATDESKVPGKVVAT